MAKKMVNDFTNGPITKAMILFAIPFMFSNLFQVLYALVDMAVVGKFVGSDGIAAVTTSSNVFTFMTMLCLGFATGGQVYISQLIGSKQYQRLNKTIGTLFTLVILFGLFMTFFGLFFRNAILHLLNTPDECYQYALDYTLVCSIGIIFTYGYNLVSAILRGMGDSKHPFIFILIASAINVVLDLLFVGKFKMAVFGAALATIIGQAVSVIIALNYLYKNRESFGFDFKKESFIPDKVITLKLLEIGIPFAIQNAAINVSMMFVTSLINGMGATATATFGIGLKVDDVIGKFTQGILYAVSTMVGQNVACKQFDRTRNIVWNGIFISGAFYFIWAIMMITCGKTLFSVFTDNKTVISLAPVYVSAILFNYPAMVIMRGSNGLIQGIGNSKLSLVFALLDGFIFRIWFSYIFGTVLGLGLYGFFLGYGLATYGTALPGLIYFISGRWEKYSLLGD